MNSLEFIERLKEKEESMIKTYEEYFKTDKTKFDKQITKGYIQNHQKNIVYLNQIKEELEAWEVVKNKSVDMHDIIHCSSLEVFNCCLYKDYQLTEQEYKIIKKALEVKDDK